MNTKMKKSQIEMIGLLIIVILVIVVGVIFLRLRTAPKEDILSTARENILISNLIESFTKMSIGCEKNMDDVVEMCVKNGGVICGKKSCEYFEESFKDVAKKVLGKGRCYEIELEEADIKIVTEEKNCDCPNAKKICEKYTSLDFTIKVCVWASC